MGSNTTHRRDAENAEVAQRISNQDSTEISLKTSHFLANMISFDFAPRALKKGPEDADV